jgi:hypothetical protein
MLQIRISESPDGPQVVSLHRRALVGIGPDAGDGPREEDTSARV